MKKILFIAITLPFAYLLPAQDFVDNALLFSRTQPGGSARIQALGGTQISLGGDYSSALSNPAGLGMYNKSEVTFSMETGGNTSSGKLKISKGEESGNFLELKSIASDCDHDTLLIKAHPTGPVCHTGADTCWSEPNDTGNFLLYLEEIIRLRKQVSPDESYVASLFSKGINKIAQKVGEEAVELVIEAKDNNDELFLNEAADLLFHYLLLLNAKGHNLQNVMDILQKRHSK